ncbi:MAG: ABC transporter ATP-binding protein [Verrucomicrobiales bacterium]|nr:ABC transporter ATP-binding protein [Verrucomicrobiales bacterium]
MTTEKKNIVVEARDLCFRYTTPLVLEKATFTVEEGDSICVIGPNGGGKSTLLKLLLGLLEPRSGSLKILGKNPGDAASDLGYVPQAMRFDPLFPITALDIALMGRLDRLKVGRFSKKCRKIALEALAEVDMADLAHRPFSDLSGGQRQRVMIARALACEPEILLLDEPTASIDLSVEAQFIETLKKLRGKMTIILVTHDLDIVSEIADSTLCVNHRVHRHEVPLSGETIREIYSGKRRIEHDRKTRHRQGDHTHCDHD